MNIVGGQIARSVAVAVQIIAGFLSDRLHVRVVEHHACKEDGPLAAAAVSSFAHPVPEAPGLDDAVEVDAELDVPDHQGFLLLHREVQVQHQCPDADVGVHFPPVVGHVELGMLHPPDPPALMIDPRGSKEAFDVAQARSIGNRGQAPQKRIVQIRLVELHGFICSGVGRPEASRRRSRIQHRQNCRPLHLWNGAGLCSADCRDQRRPGLNNQRIARGPIERHVQCSGVGVGVHGTVITLCSIGLAGVEHRPVHDATADGCGRRGNPCDGYRTDYPEISIGELADGAIVIEFPCDAELLDGVRSVGNVIGPQKGIGRSVGLLNHHDIAAVCLRFHLIQGFPGLGTGAGIGRTPGGGVQIICRRLSRDRGSQEQQQEHTPDWCGGASYRTTCSVLIMAPPGQLPEYHSYPQFPVLALMPLHRRRLP